MAYLRRTHKYGIEMHKTIKRAPELDRDSRTTFWKYTIEKEIKNIMIVFEFPDDGKESQYLFVKQRSTTS